MSININDALAALNLRYTELTALVPNIYNFTDYTDVANKHNILDGGSDMYDRANYLNTNNTNIYNNVRINKALSLNTHILYNHTTQSSVNTFGANFSYNQNTNITQNNNFGVGSSYFTCMYPGMFVLVANNISITEFSITGNIGVDGSGALSTYNTEFTSNDQGYTLYKKTIYNTTDPSINHIIILPGTSLGTIQTVDSTRQYDDHLISNIPESVDFIYYILTSRKTTSGLLLSNEDAVAIANKFVEIIGGYEAEEETNYDTTSNGSILFYGFNYKNISIQSKGNVNYNGTSFYQYIENLNILLNNSIQSLENFGDFNLNLNIECNSINSLESFENNKVNLNIECNSINSLEEEDEYNVYKLIRTISIESKEEINNFNKLDLTVVYQVSINSSETFENDNIVERWYFVRGNYACENFKECNYRQGYIPTQAMLRNCKVKKKLILNKDRIGFYMSESDYNKFCN